MVDEKSILEIFEHYFEGSEDIIQRGRYSFGDDGLMHVYGNVTRRFLEPMPDGMWPVAFGVIHGDVDMSNCGLSDLGGSPQEIHGVMSIADNPFTSLEGVTQHISNQLDITGADQLKTLEGLPPDVSVMLTWREDLPMLRLLTAKWIEFDWFQMQKTGNSPEKRCLSILRKYRHLGKAGAFDCRQELRKAGFEGNAKW